jgi:hypothetical protein
MVRGVLRWERQTKFSRYKCQGPWQRNVFLMKKFIAKGFHIFEERREEEGEKVKHEESSQNNPLWTYIKKINTSALWCMSLLLVHIWSTPSQGTNGLKNTYKTTEPWKCDHGKCPLTWDDFMVHDVNNPSIVNTICINQ